MKFLIPSMTLASVLAFACAPSNPQEMGKPKNLTPPETIRQANQVAPVATKVVFQPKADVLFVVDNSDSMQTPQKNMNDNIDKFVAAFEADKRLDFHIGVTSIFDSRRYGPVVKKFWPIGKLFPIVDGKNPVVPDGQWPSFDDGALGSDFVTRSPGYGTVLGKSLKIGVIHREDLHGNDLGGPEFEELFSPVIPALDGRNPGFVRQDAHLAVIFITDADDVSSISPSKLASDLLRLKGNDQSMVSTFAVLSISQGCHRDPGNRKTKDNPNYVENGQILEFLKDTRGHSYDLCDKNFGARLAEAGKLIDRNAAKAMKINLDSVPEAGTLKVTLSGTSREIPYQYDPSNYSVTIQSSAMDGQPLDAQIEVTYIPVDVRSLGTNRTKAASL